MGPKGESCISCRFACRQSSQDGEDDERHPLGDDDLECRRYPGVIVPRAAGEANARPYDAHWPVVMDNYWCGEWQANCQQIEPQTKRAVFRKQAIHQILKKHGVGRTYDEIERYSRVIDEHSDLSFDQLCQVLAIKSGTKRYQAMLLVFDIKKNPGRYLAKILEPANTSGGCLHSEKCSDQIS